MEITLLLSLGVVTVFFGGVATVCCGKLYKFSQEKQALVREKDRLTEQVIQLKRIEHFLYRSYNKANVARRDAEIRAETLRKGKESLQKQLDAKAPQLELEGEGQTSSKAEIVMSSPSEDIGLSIPPLRILSPAEEYAFNPNLMLWLDSVPDPDTVLRWIPFSFLYFLFLRRNAITFSILGSFLATFFAKLVDSDLKREI